MAKVFITNDTGLDYSSAEEYGKLFPLTKGSVDVFRPHLVQHAVDIGLEQFDAKEDYLLLAGAALATGFAFRYLALHADDGRERDEVIVKLLMFDAKTRKYFVRTITV